MKRWLLWLLFPPVLVLVFALTVRFGLVSMDHAKLVSFVLFWVWVALTVIAAPLTIIRWLTHGARSRQRAVD